MKMSTGCGLACRPGAVPPQLPDLAARCRGQGGDILCQPSGAMIWNYLIAWLCGSGRRRGDRGEGPVAVGGVDGLVVGHVVGEAVPEHLEPAVAGGSQGCVVVLAAGALGVVEGSGPGGAA